MENAAGFKLGSNLADTFLIFSLRHHRISPYFFNAGLFSTGSLLASIGRCYAQTIVSSGVKFDVLFGPAYKGIPLVSITSLILFTEFGMDVKYCYNRKEAKTHGEGGSIVGAKLEGRVLVLDDVITAGTAIRESTDLIAKVGAELAGVVVAIDRQEKGRAEKSAIQEVEEEFGVPVLTVINLGNIIEYVEKKGGREEQLALMREYRVTYGV